MQVWLKVFGDIRIIQGGLYTIARAQGGEVGGHGGVNIICDLIAASSTFDDSNSIATH